MWQEIYHRYYEQDYCLEEYHLDRELKLIWDYLNDCGEWRVLYLIHWWEDLVFHTVTGGCYADGILLDEEEVVAEVNAQTAGKGHPEDINIAVGSRFAVDFVHFQVVLVWGTKAITKALHSLIVLKIFH